MNILFPIAGFGRRFFEKGFTVPKPFIKVNGVTLIELAMSSLTLPGTYHVIARDLEKEYIDELVSIFKRNDIKGKIHLLHRSTSGAAETCLEAENFVNPDEPLIITNCDQYTPWNYESYLAFLETLQRDDIDAVVTTYDHGDIVWAEKSPYSFIKMDENGFAEKFAEKFAISEDALNGIHYWKRASDFFSSAKKLLQDDAVTQEKYISLTFNYLIDEGKKITSYRMRNDEFYALGTPGEVEKNTPFIEPNKNFSIKQHKINP